MSRPIEFRAWTGKQMMYQGNQYLGSFIRRVVMQVMLDRAIDEPRDHESYLPDGTSIDDYLMQFTDYSDKNQRKIFDGDFLSNAWGKYRVYWDRGGFVVQCEDGKRYNIGDIECSTMEIIGNTRENTGLFQIAAEE